jgi:hypothetical protein
LKAEFPLLAADIDKYIAALKRIPGTVTTAVNVRYGGGAGGTGVNGSGVSGDTGNNAVGPTPVGDKRGSSVGGGRANAAEAAPVFNITVNAGLGTDGTAVGRQVVLEIKRQLDIIERGG